MICDHLEQAVDELRAARRMVRVGNTHAADDRLHRAIGILREAGDDVFRRETGREPPKVRHTVDELEPLAPEP